MPQLQNLDIAEGRDFTATDEEHASQVAIIGTDIRDNLFPRGRSAGPGAARGRHSRTP